MLQGAETLGRLLGAAIVCLGLAGLGACASAKESSAVALPLMSEPSTPGYPDLRSVPQNHLANTDRTHWADVRSDVMTAMSTLKDNPRSEYGAPPEDPAQFLEDARQVLIETRDSH